MPEIVDFIAKFSDIAEDQEAMGKSFRNEELLLVFFRQFDAIPLTIGLGITAQIDSDIKDTAADGTDEFALREMLLEMKSPKYAFSAHALIILNKIDMESRFFHVLLIIRFHEISTAIAMDRRHNDTKPVNTAHILFNLYLTH